MPCGYHGKILRVDLSTGEIGIDLHGDDFYRRYLGGGALATYYLLREMRAGVDPLGPDSLLVFACSIVNGTLAAGTTRYTVACKSPLTGGYGEAEAGGWWAPEFKRAGFDAVVFRGRAPKPVYLWVADGRAELRDASMAWGKITGEAQAAIRADLGEPKARIAMIGPAGEKLVRYACVLNELKHANGRAGTGAVMGSKNLKAIACRGTLGVDVADQERVRRIARDFNAGYVPDAVQDCGTSAGLLGLNAGGILPTRNFQTGSFEGAEHISGQTMRDTILVGRGTCYACPVRCKREVKVAPPWQVDPLYGGPEYETLGAFGSVCGVDNLAAVARANMLCNQYGVDTISAGMSIAFAMECYERGLLTKEDTDGIDLRFGHAEAMLAMLAMICERRGLGELLGEGTARAARHIGRGAERYTLTVKGQELPMHEPRGKAGLALAYAVSPTGADHMEHEHDPLFELESPAFRKAQAAGLIETVPALELSARKARLFYYLQNVWSLYNSLGWCDIVAAPTGQFGFASIVDYVNAVTGWETSLFSLLKVGERANTMSRIFNLREGFTAQDDTLPERLFGPLGGGPLQGRRIEKDELAHALHSYYAMVGWDAQTGVPTRAKLDELDLAWADEYLAKLRGPGAQGA